MSTLIYSIISIYELIVSFKKKLSTICLKKTIDQYIQDKRQVFHVWHNLCSELTSMWTFKMYSRNTKTTNEPTASNKSDRPHVNTWDNRKTLKYLNINENRKQPITFCCLFFVNCGLFSFLNIKKVKI